MKVETRRELTPQAFLRQLFAEMKDNKVSIEYHPFIDEPYTMTYEMDWTAEDVEALVQRYETLTAALTKIGNHYEQMNFADMRESLLTPQEQEVWNTYIRPFDPFEVDLSVVSELQFRSETETLDDEEYDLLDRHFQWYEENCLQRLPVLKRSPYAVVNRAKRYTRLISMNAPEIVVTEEGRYLAEELALYYHEVQRPRLDFSHFYEAQQGVYAKALAEVQSGKKKTHWMWFIFPQLRGLGESELSHKYGIVDLNMAKAYLEDIVLGNRLRGITKELLELKENNPEAIFGDIDAMKLRSSMTLFAHADGQEDSVFRKVLQKYFNGVEDEKTVSAILF